MVTCDRCKHKLTPKEFFDAQWGYDFVTCRPCYNELQNGSSKIQNELQLVEKQRREEWKRNYRKPE